MASEEIRRLQEQNSVLRAVVTQMRTDMERLSQLQLQPQASSPQLPHQDALVVTGQPAQPPDISSSIHAAGMTLC
ncbi:MAG: hypothetical protein ATN33_01305 [Epulopiscium sp. Nele67-Bin001]|nr:MAG: hypothetical protein ATN33_01305 [Epulopiscium sp. Nele67-Bin001]